MSASDVAKPLVRRPRCFGGGQGVWWRRKQTQIPMDDGSSKEASESKNFKMDSEIQWDEELCRPIYRKKSSQEDSIEAVVSDGDNNNSNCGKSSPPESKNRATAGPSSTSIAARWDKDVPTRIYRDGVSPEHGEFVISGGNNTNDHEGTSQKSSPLPSSPFSPCTNPSVDNSESDTEIQSDKELCRSLSKTVHDESSNSVVNDHRDNQQEVTSSGTSPLPKKFNTLLVKRRRSFGGTQGVWWRRQTTTAADGPSISQPSDSTTSKNSPNQSAQGDDAEIQWDEDLCRPIYRVKHSPEYMESFLEDGDDHHDEGISDTSSPTTSSPTTSSLNKQVHALTKRLWSKVPVKRNKTFGTRKSPYSFLLLDSNIDSASTPPSPITPSSSQYSTSSTLSSALSFAESKRPGAVSSKSSSNSKKNKQRQVMPKEEASLRRAKQYFDELDAVSLMLDSSKSPLCSSKVTRTSHKVNLQSPRLQREYQQHVRASQASGIPPWSIETYVSSRRDFFRKQELFDGFLDD